MAGTWIKKRSDTIETSSKLRAWWLNTFYGYEILGQKLLPRKRFYGSIIYDRRWLLKPDVKPK